MAKFLPFVAIFVVSLIFPPLGLVFGGIGIGIALVAYWEKRALNKLQRQINEGSSGYESILKTAADLRRSDFKG